MAAASMGLASLPAHATILNLNAFASGNFTSGIESGFELTTLNGRLLNSAREGTGNIENNAAFSAFAVLSLRRQDGGKFTFLGADFGHFEA